MQQTACSKGAHRRLTLLVSGGVALGLASWTYGQCKNDCGAGNVAEDEPCLVDLDEDTTNGGCNSDPNVFGSARCGDIICGTASTYDIDTDGDGIADTDARDTDWYLLDAAELALADVDGNGVVQIQAFLTSEFDGVTFIVSLGDPICSTTDIIGQTGFSAAGCAGGDPAVGTLILADHPNGVAVFVAPGNADGTPIFDGFECGLGANDYILVIECIELETVCAPGSGPCDEPNGTPGCEDRDCCVLVCDIDLGDPLCCIFEWNDNCANLALELCGGGCNACGDVACGSCDVDNGSPFCDDAACCDLVCAVDPFCCDVTWDDICAGEAVDICVCKPGDEPRNNDCANAIPVSEGVFAYSTLCATHDGPTEPTQFDCDDKVGAAPGVGLEVWFDYTPSFSGLARVYTCEQADYNTALAVYDGCACPAPDADIIDCNDEGLTCPPLDTGSEVVFPAIAGNCYKIAVGGRYGFSGTGTLTIELTRIPGPCVDGVGNCLQANGSPGCDQFDCCFDICEVNPDCCDVDWDQACADLAAGTCSPLPCAPIDTSGANVIEPEACGEDTNAGCNNVPTDLTDIDPSMFTDIVSGDVIAGTAWADGGARDTDWYLINVTAEDDADGDGMVDIHYNILGELPVVSFALEDPGSDCGDDVDIVGTVAYSQSCVQVGFGVVTVAAPGTYYIFAGTGNEGGGGIFDGYPCPPPGVGVFGNQYLLCVTVVDDGQPAVTDCPPAAPPCPADFDLSGAVDVKDLLFLLGAWGPCPKQGDCPADFDLSGAVDVKDLLFLLGAWGPC